MTKRAAIILAGGKAKRFQTTMDQWQDKALAELDGQPLLIHAIRNIQSIIDEVVVVVNEDKERTAKYHALIEQNQFKNTRIVTDLKVKYLSGPLIAILTGLKSTDADYCITVPCDVPMLDPKVANYLFNQIDGLTVAVPMWPNGRLETLLMVLERKSSVEIASLLSRLGRSHPDDLIRGASKSLLVSPVGDIKNIDPEFKSFINVNCREDLSRLIPRKGEGQFTENVQLSAEVVDEDIKRLSEATLKKDKANFSVAASDFLEAASGFERKNMRAAFWAAVSREYQSKSLCCLLQQSGRHELIAEIEESLRKAAEDYGRESQYYEAHRCYLLAQRAQADMNWCVIQIEKLAAK
jgi:molybdenum cofactor guanylyltransferase